MLRMNLIMQGSSSMDLFGAQNWNFNKYLIGVIKGVTYMAPFYFSV